MPVSPAVFYIITCSGPRQWSGIARVSGQLGDFTSGFGTDPALVQRSDRPEAIILKYAGVADAREQSQLRGSARARRGLAECRVQPAGCRQDPRRQLRPRLCRVPRIGALRHAAIATCAVRYPARGLLPQRRRVRSAAAHGAGGGRARRRAQKPSMGAEELAGRRPGAVRARPRRRRPADRCGTGRCRA